MNNTVADIFNSQFIRLTVFTGQKTQPTESKNWRRCCRGEGKQRKQQNTHINRQ